MSALPIPDVLPGREVIYAIADEINQVHHDFRAQGLPYGDEVAARLDDCATVTPEQSAQGRDWQRMIRTRFADAFEEVDLILTPTVPAMRKLIGVDTIGDLHYRVVLSWFTSIVNHALLPAVAMPLIGSGEPSCVAAGDRSDGLRGDAPRIRGRPGVQGVVGFVPRTFNLGSPTGR